MSQDWFEQNKPEMSKDWFAQNAPEKLPSGPIDRFMGRTRAKAREAWMREPHSSQPAPMWEGSDRNLMDLRGAEKALPAAGMVVGGIIGAPGIATAAAGAAAGAGLGRAAEEMIEEHEGSPRPSGGQEAVNLGVAAGEGGLSELGGALVTKGIEKTASALAPAAEKLSDKLILSLIKPGMKSRVAGSASQFQSDHEIARAVADVAGSSKNLESLHGKIVNKVDDLNAETERLLAGYKSEWRGQSVSGGQTIEGQPVQSTPQLQSGQKVLTSGAPQLPAPASIEPSTGAPSGMPKAGTPQSAAAPTAVPGPPEAKVFTKQGGIPITRILRFRGQQAIRDLSERYVPDKSRTVARLMQMVRDRAGKNELTPREALSLRRFIRREMHWPAGTNGLRDQIYRDLNNQIEMYLQPEDARVFRSNNASIHRLLIAERAVDQAAHRSLTTSLGHGGTVTGTAVKAVTGGQAGRLAAAKAARSAARSMQNVMPVAEGAGKAASTALMEATQ